MAVYPFKGIDKYWKYNNPDPSTSHYGAIIANEIISGLPNKIKDRGKEIYHVRPKAIIVQDLYHETIRQLAKMLNENIKEIERFEKENSNDLGNYAWSESAE